MANSYSSQGIRKILSKLDEYDIFALASTVTQGLLKVDSVDEAVSGILKHSPTLVSILRRKVITKEILFSYLDENDISIKSPASKNDLIDRIIEFWDLQSSEKASDQSATLEVAVAEGNVISEGDHIIGQLAEQFTKWFYTMLNSDEGVGIEHFYADAKLKLITVTDKDCDIKEIADNPQDISSALQALKLQHHLYFNPNFSNDGIKGQIDPHGLVVVFTCGTIHVKDSIVGVFEQVFSLARDPFCDNNWKIKKTELNLRSKNSSLGQPQLCDSERTSDLLALTESTSTTS
ncbi:unnamed protein product [Callosobruchus maculatus]|uniref:NTF2 domain-containing protein n=1 Tax=Callosobruchus maculatus TaxID=64391 RepID=A0A653DA32_CALMS|nr:unnamed protein product [Callosobruchus maculatus]